MTTNKNKQFPNKQFPNKQGRNKQCRGFQKMMDHHVCGSLSQGDQAKLAEHTRQCPECARAFTTIKETYAFLGSTTQEAPVPTPDWDASWRAIRKNVIDNQPRRTKKSPRFIWGLAAAAGIILFILGIGVGRLFFVSPTHTHLPETDAENMRLLQTALRNHMEDIKPVIIQYANVNQNGGPDESMALDRQMAARLLAKNRAFHQRLEQLPPGKRKQLTLLLEELDLILTEIANLTADEPENISLVKELIKMKGIRSKIELMPFYMNEIAAPTSAEEDTRDTRETRNI